MGWNGSSAATGAAMNKKIAKPRKASSGAPMSGAFKGTLALILILAIGAGAYWYVTNALPKVKAEAEEKTENKSIAEVEPEIAEKAVEKPVAKDEVRKPLRKLEYWEMDVMPENLSPAQQRKWKAMHRAPAGITNDTSRTEAPPRYAIFNHHSENEIACLLTLTPGEILVGEPVYSKGFVNDFLKSCEEPIVINEDDDEYTRDLKQQMREVKIELRDRMRNGEDLGEILSETRAEYRKLAAYKDQVREAFMDINSEGAASEADLDASIEAVNKMLEAKGVAPMEVSPITRHVLLKRGGAL